MSISEAEIRQLEKRARGLRRLIASLNDLNMYGINSAIDRMLFEKIKDLKEHLKKKITSNNVKLNAFYSKSIDSLVDDDYQQGEVRTESSFVSKDYKEDPGSFSNDLEHHNQQIDKNNHNQDI
tara:strand:+ start:1841 stop:2209 length:369 start_codon:yes stop_codon:yes gene_type:complete